MLAGLVVTACGGRASTGGGARLPSAAPSSTERPTVGTPHNATPPPARSGAALAFDPVTTRLLLFGGATAADQAHPPDSVRLADTWTWDGHTWTQVQPASSPPSLYGAVLVPDPQNHGLVLLSGSGSADPSGALLQEGSWTWDGQTWKRTADNPLQMPFPAAAPDPVHHQILLSGLDSGYPNVCGARTSVCPSLTPIDKPSAYVSNGTSWLPAAGQAPKWAGAGTAYDPMSRRVVSSGGAQQTGLQSTYAWDGHQWQVLSQSPSVNGVPDPSYPAGPCTAATDAAAGQVVMVCSFTNNGTAVGATWTFDGTNWNRAQNANTPLPPILSLSLAYDPAVGAVVMVYPGSSGTESMLMWNGNDWAAIPS
jgi:hypothetical protein